MTARTNASHVPVNTDADPAQPELSEEYWLYAGRRLSPAGKPIDAWVPGDEGCLLALAPCPCSSRG
jgi:hypothetical protein